MLHRLRDPGSHITVANMLKAVIASAALAGCAQAYAYSFDVRDPAGQPAGTSYDDNAIHADVSVADNAIKLAITNKSGDTMQVAWTHIALDRGNGTTTALHPSGDVGWIQAGATVTAQLVPLTFPPSGSDALAYNNRDLDLSVPAIVHREAQTFHVHLVSHVAPKK